MIHGQGEWFLFLFFLMVSKTLGHYLDNNILGPTCAEHIIEYSNIPEYDLMVQECDHEIKFCKPLCIMSKLGMLNAEGFFIPGKAKTVLQAMLPPVQNSFRATELTGAWESCSASFNFNQHLGVKNGCESYAHLLDCFRRSSLMICDGVKGHELTEDNVGTAAESWPKAYSTMMDTKDHHRQAPPPPFSPSAIQQSDPAPAPSSSTSQVQQQQPASSSQNEVQQPNPNQGQSPQSQQNPNVQSSSQQVVSTPQNPQIPQPPPPVPSMPQTPLGQSQPFLPPTNYQQQGPPNPRQGQIPPQNSAPQPSRPSYLQFSQGQQIRPFHQQNVQGLPPHLQNQRFRPQPSSYSRPQQQQQPIMMPQSQPPQLQFPQNFGQQFSRPGPSSIAPAIPRQPQPPPQFGSQPFQPRPGPPMNYNYMPSPYRHQPQQHVPLNRGGMPNT